MTKRGFYLFFLIFSFVIFIFAFNTMYHTPTDLIISEYVADIDPLLLNRELISNLKESNNNKDIVGLIKIPGTSINEPIVQAKDNSYYLSHNLLKEKSKNGAVFMDYRNKLTDSQINIYGHNSNVRDVPFKELVKYKEEDFFNKNKYIYIYTNDDTLIYEIYAVKRTKENEHMILDSNNIVSHLKKIRQNSIYDSKVKVDKNDDILILQTCLLKDNGNLLLIEAKKIS